ncbi:FxsA family protein [Litoreibacter arenae]|uniref:FxsA protein n=1 Tax=Litoreibacter arenae DSM 19593 TaxID=1123360 RepID=S9QDI9_9RHOB|nr:FxsA family protein [Litoreibacter arenae]EPX77628.1 FxsA protein [Litoreibacter arenae DSM 19593]
MWLFLLFVTIPIVEIALFIQVGGWLGLWPTLAIVILTAILGTVLVRAQGIMALSQIRSNLQEFQDPTESLAHGAMILASGLLLLTPGFFTDAVGFALLVPPVRLGLFKWIRSKVKVQSFVKTSYRQEPRPPQGQDIIDGEFSELDDDAPRPTHEPPSGWTRH